ncbi:MAG: hypothetical protein GY859_17965 [Desulfobacterales bacterium]|nr:hypothetical protein [Desulfobacterales bacterium]
MGKTTDEAAKPQGEEGAAVQSDYNVRKRRRPEGEAESDVGQPEEEPAVSGQSNPETWDQLASLSGVSPQATANISQFDAQRLTPGSPRHSPFPINDSAI